MEWSDFDEAAGTLTITGKVIRAAGKRGLMRIDETKTVAGRRTLPLDDEGLSARIGADHLGHTRISMTQDKYMARGRVHTAVADMLDSAINGE